MPAPRAPGSGRDNGGQEADLEDGEAVDRLLRRRHEHALALLVRPPDAAAQLVQLQEAKALGVLDDHECGIWHIDTYLNDDCRDEQPARAGLEGVEHKRLLLPRELPGDEHAVMAQELVVRLLHLLVRLHSSGTVTCCTARRHGTETTTMAARP